LPPKTAYTSFIVWWGRTFRPDAQFLPPHRKQSIFQPFMGRNGVLSKPSESAVNNKIRLPAARRLRRFKTAAFTLISALAAMEIKRSSGRLYFPFAAAIVSS